MTEDEIADRLDALPALVNGRTALIRRGRLLSTVFLFGAGDLPIYVTIGAGRIEQVTRGPVLMRSWSFAIRAAADSWTRFWEPTPRPGYQDLLAMTRFGHARIDGDLYPLMSHLRYVKEVLEAPRGGVPGGTP